MTYSTIVTDKLAETDRYDLRPFLRRGDPVPLLRSEFQRRAGLTEALAKAQLMNASQAKLVRSSRTNSITIYDLTPLGHAVALAQAGLGERKGAA